MLLRSDPQFVFYCQAINVLCALIETAHLVVRPRIRDETRTNSRTEFVYCDSLYTLFRCKCLVLGGRVLFCDWMFGAAAILLKVVISWTLAAHCSKSFFARLSRSSSFLR